MIKCCETNYLNHQIPDSVEDAVHFGSIVSFDFLAATLFVQTSTVVTKVHTTLASHVIAAMRLLYPNFALRTLLELTAFNKFQEFLVIFVGLC